LFLFLLFFFQHIKYSVEKIKLPETFMKKWHFQDLSKIPLIPSYQKPPQNVANLFFIICPYELQPIATAAYLPCRKYRPYFFFGNPFLIMELSTLKWNLTEIASNDPNLVVPIRYSLIIFLEFLMWPCFPIRFSMNHLFA
jgi:hypothetical protein